MLTELKAKSDTELAEKLAQKGNEIVGKITRVHGKKGAVIARFNKGLPGQAIGTSVQIIS